MGLSGAIGCEHLSHLADLGSVRLQRGSDLSDHIRQSTAAGYAAQEGRPIPPASTSISPNRWATGGSPRYLGAMLPRWSDVIKVSDDVESDSRGRLLARRVNTDRSALIQRVERLPASTPDTI